MMNLQKCIDDNFDGGCEELTVNIRKNGDTTTCSIRPGDHVTGYTDFEVVGNHVILHPLGSRIEQNTFDFGTAIAFLKRGHKVARTGWNGKSMFLFLVEGSTFKVNRPPLLGIYPKGTEINYCPHIDMKTADGKIVPWLASQTDVLAEDWCFVTDPV